MNTETKIGKGRPTIYSEELIKELCDTIACTPKSYETILEKNPHFPSTSVLYRWLEEPERAHFREMYLRAKKKQVDAHVAHTIKIADDITFGDFKTANADVQKANTQISVRQWYASRLAPRLYGEKPEPQDEEKKKDEDLSESECLDKIVEIAAAAKKRAETTKE